MHFLRKYGIGDYPAAYNPKVHGPYDPARFYGKPDTPFGEVKLSELSKWILRRNMKPSAVAGLFSRGFWRWQHAFAQAKFGGLSYVLQVTAACSVFFYCINYARTKEHRNRKYHW